MLLVIGIIAIAMLVVSIIFCCVCESDEAKVGWGFGVGTSAFCTLALLIAIICGTVELSTQHRIDEKITMLTEENTTIETKITATVEKYLEHEYQIFDSLQGEDIQTLLVVYPEINSNELVKQQIEVFIQNNNTIKELKNEKIGLSVWKFLLYFG